MSRSMRYPLERGCCACWSAAMRSIGSRRGARSSPRTCGSVSSLRRPSSVSPARSGSSAARAAPRARAPNVPLIAAKLEALGLVLPKAVRPPAGVVLPFRLVHVRGYRVLRVGARAAESRRDAGAAARQGGARPVRRAGLSCGAPDGARDARQHRARARRSRPRASVDARVRHGQLGGGLQSAAARDERFLGSDPRAVRSRLRRAFAQRRRNGRAAVRLARRDRSRARDRPP